jgi:hypothetical protein
MTKKSSTLLKDSWFENPYWLLYDASWWLQKTKISRGSKRGFFKTYKLNSLMDGLPNLYSLFSYLCLLFVLFKIYFRTSIKEKDKMSTKFTEYKGLDLPTVASEVLDFERKHIWEKCNYTWRNNLRVFLGPPSANGLPEFTM